MQDLLDRVNQGATAFNRKEMVEVLAMVLPRVIDIEGIPKLLNINLSSAQVRVLQQRLGAAFTVLIGSHSGRYRLDLSNPHDRICALRLAEVDNMEQRWLRGAVRQKAEDGRKHAKSDRSHEAQLESFLIRLAEGGMSQHGNWTGFRNVKFRGADVGR